MAAICLAIDAKQVPRDSNSDKRTEDETTVHDQVLWVLHKSGMEDLMLFLASSDDEAQYCLHVLEIISLMFREQVSSLRIPLSFAILTLLSIRFISI